MRKKSFDKEIYEKLGTNDLILFTIYLVIDDKEDCSFERIVDRSFSLFPEKFCFPKISDWPDSRKLDRPLRTLRKKKLITGSPKTSFFLTRLGKKMAEGIAKTFRQKKLKL